MANRSAEEIKAEIKETSSKIYDLITKSFCEKTRKLIMPENVPEINRLIRHKKNLYLELDRERWKVFESKKKKD